MPENPKKATSPTNSALADLSPDQADAIVGSVSEACWAKFAHVPLVAILVAEKKVAVGGNSSEEIAALMNLDYRGQSYIRAISKHHWQASRKRRVG